MVEGALLHQAGEMGDVSASSFSLHQPLPFAAVAVAYALIVGASGFYLCCHKSLNGLG